MSLKHINARQSEIRALSIKALTEIFHQFDTSSHGLSPKQASAKLKEFGPNLVVGEIQEWLVIRFLKLFLSPLSVLLMVLSLVSYLTGEGKGALIIALMVFLSTTLSFFQEYRANKVAEKLKNLVTTKITVIRGGVKLIVDLSAIVPGDLIVLSAGDLIPADVRLIATKDLYVNQSSLTGESLPVEKSDLITTDQKDSAFDWPNICYMGSHITSGTAHAIVLKTGTRTFFAEIVRDTTQQTKQTSFDKGIQKYIWLMIRFMLVMVPLVFLINGLIKHDWLEAALFAVAVSIGLAPEMLPMLVTINLAKGALVMSKKRVIVKRLNAIQNLGAMDVLCTDKTGTLTQDEVILERHIDVSGKPNTQVLEFAYLNSHYQSGLKNLLDIAVLKHAEVHEKLHSADSYKKIDEIPFDFQRRRMSVVVQKNEENHILISKGAVEEIFSCCRYAQLGNELVPFDEEQRQRLKRVTADLNQDGFRVIAIAIKNEAIRHIPYSVSDETEMILVGYIAFLDPPKESAKPAIQALKDAGVQIKILTGDNELITQKICHDVGISVEHVVLGTHIDAMTDQYLADVAESTIVFAKMAPYQKARVIKALQMNGHVVGYLGDGINDGPGLKAADISLSVDTAVDIAKESADIILLEKNLLILHEGVVEGRRVFSNLIKYLKMASSSNLGNSISMVGASAFLPFLPMAPVQVILNDFLYDLSQTAVPTDNVDEEYLMRPQQWDMKSVAHYMFFIGPISSIFDCLTFAFLWFFLKANTIELSGLFQTGWFVQSLISQTLVIHIIRTGKIPFIESSPSPILLLTTLSICGIAIFLPYSFLADDLHLQRLPEEYWYGLAVLLTCYLLLTQLVKSFLVKRIGVV
jgi:Mg2+-importing ATPase